MSKVLGIIAEYNPFHNGHLYHLNQSQKLNNYNYTVAIISGNFTQRGEPSLINKWEKAKSALLCGIDLVIELPTVYATSSAENFAEGAIKILDSLNIINDITFGAETPNIDLLQTFANIFYTEPQAYKDFLNQELKKGVSYPRARQNALNAYIQTKKNSTSLNDKLKLTKKDLDSISFSNNILAIEYLKALKKLNSNINPIAIKRIGNNYNDTKIHKNISSATAIRTILQTPNDKNYKKLKNLMPTQSYNILKQNIKDGQIITNLNTFEKIIIYNLRQMPLKQIKNFPDVSEGLENLLKKSAETYNTIDELIQYCSSKRYPQNRIRRILLYSLLNITKNDISISKKILPYIRILGFNKKGQELISKIAKQNPNLHIITSVKQFEKTNTNKNLQLLLQKDINSTNIYTLGFTKKPFSNLDYTYKLPIIL